MAYGTHPACECWCLHRVLLSLLSHCAWVFLLPCQAAEAIGPPRNQSELQRKKDVQEGTVSSAFRIPAPARRLLNATKPYDRLPNLWYGRRNFTPAESSSTGSPSTTVGKLPLLLPRPAFCRNKSSRQTNLCTWKAILKNMSLHWFYLRVTPCRR